MPVADSSAVSGMRYQPPRSSSPRVPAGFALSAAAVSALAGEAGFGPRIRPFSGGSWAAGVCGTGWSGTSAGRNNRTAAVPLASSRQHARRIEKSKCWTTRLRQILLPEVYTSRSLKWAISYPARQRKRGTASWDFSSRFAASNPIAKVGLKPTACIPAATSSTGCPAIPSPCLMAALSSSGVIGFRFLVERLQCLFQTVHQCLIVEKVDEANGFKPSITSSSDEPDPPSIGGLIAAQRRRRQFGERRQIRPCGGRFRRSSACPTPWPPCCAAESGSSLSLSMVSRAGGTSFCGPCFPRRPARRRPARASSGCRRHERSSESGRQQSRAIRTIYRLCHVGIGQAALPWSRPGGPAGHGGHADGIDLVPVTQRCQQGIDGLGRIDLADRQHGIHADSRVVSPSLATFVM